LSPLGLARAGLDLLLPKSAAGEDVALGSLVRRRLGAQVADRLVAPLIGGIYAGDVDRLSARAVAPAVFAAAERERSLIRAMRTSAKNRAAQPRRGLIHLRGGMAKL